MYLTLETDDRPLQDDFRRRALGASVLSGALALAVFLLAEDGAPTIRRGLASSPWTWPVQIATGALALGALAGLLLAGAGLVLQLLTPLLDEVLRLALGLLGDLLGLVGGGRGDLAAGLGRGRRRIA